MEKDLKMEIVSMRVVQNNYPVGIFKFYYETSELKGEKEFFTQVKQSTFFITKMVKL